MKVVKRVSVWTEGRLIECRFVGNFMGEFYHLLSECFFKILQNDLGLLFNRLMKGISKQTLLEHSQPMQNWTAGIAAAPSDLGRSGLTFHPLRGAPHPPR